MSRAMGVALAAALVAVPAGARTLDIEVTTVRATSSGPTDPAVQSLRPRLKRFVAYRAFRVVQRQDRRCAWRTEEAFVLPDGRSLLILPKRMEDEKVMMQVRLLDGRRRLVDTHVRLRNGGTMLFGVNHRDGDGDGATIIVLKAEE